MQLSVQIHSEYALKKVAFLTYLTLKSLFRRYPEHQLGDVWRPGAGEEELGQWHLGSALHRGRHDVGRFVPLFSFTV